MFPAWTLALLACAPAAPIAPAEALQAALDDAVARDPRLPGVSLVVASPTFDFAGASGAVSLEPAAPEMTVGAPFRAASVTKSFVSAALLRLHERGALSLDDPLRTHLSGGSAAALERGGYDPDAITVRQLLAHTAGMFDYTATQGFQDQLAADPTHRWTRAEQLDLAMDEGEPLFAPGEGYAYGDTHYILAGEVLERATGVGLGPALRETLDYAALGLGDTWLESLEDPPTSDALDRLAHPYDGGIDTRDWDPSWDLYGGGGLVSTAGDLATFIEALVGGDLLGPAALSAMMEVDPVAEGAFFGIDGALGINGFDLPDGGRCWAGYGYFGTVAAHCPELGLTWAYTQNQANPRRPDAIDEEVLAAWESTLCSL